MAVTNSLHVSKGMEEVLVLFKCSMPFELLFMALTSHARHANSNVFPSI